jgi:hypothetical protein
MGFVIRDTQPYLPLETWIKQSAFDGHWIEMLLTKNDQAEQETTIQSKL